MISNYNTSHLHQHYYNKYNLVDHELCQRGGDCSVVAQHLHALHVQLKVGVVVEPACALQVGLQQVLHLPANQG